MNQFYLTLPSNSSAEYYPNNTVTQFNTRLHRSFNLVGEWEVGMTEIMFPHSWYNVGREDSFFEFYCSDCVVTVPPIHPPREYSFRFKVPMGYYASVEAIVNKMSAMIDEVFSRIVPEWNTANTAGILFNTSGNH